MRRWWLAFVCAFISVGATSQAAPLLPDIYDCKIKQYFSQQDDGMLKDQLLDPKVLYLQQTKNASFLVERRSGKFLTKADALAWIPNFEPTVLDLGSGAQALKVVYRSEPRPYLHVAYLVVKSYATGAAKPFVLIDGGSVYSGTCK